MSESKAELLARIDQLERSEQRQYERMEELRATYRRVFHEKVAAEARVQMLETVISTLAAQAALAVMGELIVREDDGVVVLTQPADSRVQFRVVSAIGETPS